MALVAATAIGFAAARAFTLEVLRNDLAPFPPIRRIPLTIWAGIVATMPIRPRAQYEWSAIWFPSLSRMIARNP